MVEQLAMSLLLGGVCQKAHSHYLHPRPFVSQAITVYSQSAESRRPFLSQRVIDLGL